jgi:hypothetical protein
VSPPRAPRRRPTTEAPSGQNSAATAKLTPVRITGGEVASEGCCNADEPVELYEFIGEPAEIRYFGHCREHHHACYVLDTTDADDISAPDLHLYAGQAATGSAA